MSTEYIIELMNYKLLVVFNATINNISLYRGGQFYWWRKPPTCRKSLLTLSHNVVSLEWDSTSQR